ncbi:hypothetical protein [Bacillus sp. FJAT-45350]|uniref:hypothetical protein n=1 Tax=Bacillus sp. FJAT-45350 TaxID=2011014 RepID=UPI0015C769F4|nr:hypothetical protein [Bacillus sp. FJAT-45350]
MTVKELREKLADMPQDATVKLDAFGELSDIEEIGVVQDGVVIQAFEDFEE